MKPFLKPKYAPVMFGLLVSGLMTFIVSGISTINALGFNAGIMNKWLIAWLTTWTVAFPIILFVAPMVQKFIKHITMKEK
ncbi:MAG: DUF2798 domain-containing protein [Gammaproteobacteria bacterium]|nr:DUF2798 domain-containing protein [Gammaproteobacteria bacterium]